MENYNVDTEIITISVLKLGRRNLTKNMFDQLPWADNTSLALEWVLGANIWGYVIIPKEKWFYRFIVLSYGGKLYKVGIDRHIEKRVSPEVWRKLNSNDTQLFLGN
jgi:hypothetical protein